MSRDLGRSIREWLNQYAHQWNMPIEQVALVIRRDEIDNRLQTYPRIAAALSTRPMDLAQLAEAARQCYVLGHQVDAIRFNEFVSNAGAAAAIQELVDHFPKTDNEAIERIDDSLARIVQLGYAKSATSPDWAGAAQLISLILTCLFPKRYVDYRRNRWHSLANTLGYKAPSASASYGEQLVWAGEFARNITRTAVYQVLWPEGEPLWVVSGVCWKNTDIQKPDPEPVDIDILGFPEGAEKRRLHLLRERNQTVVATAKALGLVSDPLLRCQVCGFSFVEAYGKIGREFIEAHHKKPVAELTPGSRTQVSDIGLVCANCHRMLHRGDRTLSIEELRTLLQRGQGLSETNNPPWPDVPRTVKRGGPGNG